MQNSKINWIIDFDLNCLNKIKSLAVKTQNEIKVTIQLMSGKLLMFAKVSLVIVFCLPDEKI